MKFIRLDELLYQAKDQLQKNQPGYRVALEFGEMPDSGEALLVRANESLLRTALLNMMQNACKYSPDQRVSVRVFFQPDGAHRIDVCDNGPGIPAEEQALIFEPFYRSPQHRGSVKGTGIGLALVRSILQLHHIALEFRAPETGGATFQLLFPAIGRTETVGNA
ncbi:MAG: ATP-binding protein [Saprospirales bacterium]|nr:ATP-binding protein [Saprospirales bacterium]